MSRTVRLLVLSIGVSGFLVLPNALTNWAHGDSGCSAGSLSGPYGVEGSGVIFGSPSAFVGTFVFNGQGKSTGSFVLNLAGNIDHIDMTGTYKVNAGCDGAMSILTPHHKPPVEHYHDIDIVVVDGGREILFVAEGAKPSESDNAAPGETLSGVMKRL